MAHPDLDLLLNALIPTARGLLEKHGSFHPFGAYLDQLGGVVPIDAHPDGGEAPRILEELTGRLRMEASGGNARATALCMDVLVVPPESTSKTDAIGLRLEHEGGEAVEVYLPYRKGSQPDLLFDSLFATPGYRRIFGAGEEAENQAARFGLPDDLDGRTLAQMAQSGAALDRPHRFEFFLYFPQQESAERAAATLGAEGFEIEIRSDEGGAEWLVFAVKSLVPEHAALLTLRRRFEALCAETEGEYDGWGAAVVES